MKLLRILISILILLIVICILVIGGLYLFLDPDRLKPALIEEVKKRGYTLTIDGPMKWSFYPKFGIKVEHMTLSVLNEPPFMDLHRVSIAAEPWQFFHREKKLQGDLYTADVKLGKLHGTKAHIGLNFQDQNLTLAPITASLYGGALLGTVYVHELTLVPKWDWDLQFNHIQMKSLLEDINGPNSKVKLSGLGQIKLHGTSQGKDKLTILSHTNGTSEFSMHNGMLDGIDLNYLIQSADALMHKQSIAPPTDISQTFFNSLTASAVISNGIVVTNNLMLISETFITSGQGSINLVSQTINILLNIKTQESIKTQWEIPVLVSGNWNHPDVRLDLKEVEQHVTKQEIENVKEKVKEKIEDIRSKAGQFFQNLLDY